MTHTIVIASGKGGTGKTSVTAGVGCALAELGHRCLMIDADVGMQSLDMALGVHQFAAFDFADAARGSISLTDAAVQLADFPLAAVLAAPPAPDDIGVNTLRSCASSRPMPANCVPSTVRRSSIPGSRTWWPNSSNIPWA